MNQADVLRELAGAVLTYQHDMLHHTEQGVGCDWCGQKAKSRISLRHKKECPIALAHDHARSAERRADGGIRSLWEIADDVCGVCGIWIGRGVRLFHLERCEECFEKAETLKRKGPAKKAPNRKRGQ